MVLMVMVLLSGGLVFGGSKVSKAAAIAIDPCNNFYEGVVDCSSTNPTNCHSCTAVGTTVTSIENAHWWCHKHFSDCNYSLIGNCTSAAFGVRHAFCGRYEGCTYTAGACVGGTYTNPDTLYEISCECSSPAVCNPDSGVCSSKNNVTATDCLACNAAGYQYSSGCLSFPIVGCGVNDGSSASCACGGVLSACWSICDDSYDASGNPTGCCSKIGNKCFDDDSDGIKETCRAAASTATTLTISADDNPVEINGSTNITFKFELASDGSDISGAKIKNINATCGTIPASAAALTNGSGEAMELYNAPAGATDCTITATATCAAADGATCDASKYDDKTATFTISIVDTTCITHKMGWNNDPYTEGDTVEVVGMSTTAIVPPDTSGACIELYDNLGVMVDRQSITLDTFDSASASSTGKAGTWTGKLYVNDFFCAGIPNCTITIDVAAAAAGPVCGDGVCSGGETNVTCPADCPPLCIPVPEVCDDGIDNDCDSMADCADGADCPDGTNCGPGGKFCDSGNCVECTPADLSNCAVGEVCDMGVCVPCEGEGEEAAAANLCCDGLGWWDMDGDGINECTSACDPSAWFFCNPLRGSVETLAEGGEQIVGYILGLIGSVALLLIIISGAMYMTSAGSEERIATSKRILTGAVIGLGIALLAYSLLAVIMGVLNM